MARGAVRAERPERVPDAIWLVHPFPSILNAVLVFGLFLLAGGALGPGLVLATGMLGLQFAIGAVNDLADQADDAATKRAKPLVQGAVSRRSAVAVAVGCAVIGLLVYAAFGPLMLLLGAAMLACGLAYDLGLKRRGLGWLCWAVAFPLLPLSTWLAATGSAPPRAALLLPIAALAGPTLQLANGLVDLERDAASGIPAPAVRLGRRRAWLVLAALTLVIHCLAWATILAGGGAPAVSLLALAAASAVAVAGLVLSSHDEIALRERGWQAQAVAIALLAAGWVAAVRP